MLGRTDSKGRLLALFAVLLVLSSGMVMRLAYWQINQHGQIAALANESDSQLRIVPAPRGTIYDRTGTIVLAQTVNRYRLTADLHDMDDVERKHDTEALVDYLGLDGSAEAAFRQAMTGNGYYVILATNIDADTGKEISDAQGRGAFQMLTLESTPVRVYPQAGGAPHTSMAAQLLGFVNASGKGQYGIEQQYDSILAGRPQRLAVDPNKPGPAGIRVVDPGAAGEDIKTTIDVGLQLKVEQEVFSTWAADKAKTVSAVVMDPKSGAVLAEASYPSYDANAYQAVAAQNPSVFMDPVISEIYEPGSVFKMLTASAALQTKTTSLSTKINDMGVLKLPGGQEVADADRRSKGWMTFADIVAWSRNVGVSQAAFRLGKNTTAASAELYKTWQTYGIGQATGIDLPGEVAGIVSDPASDPWAQIDLANRSFGQGVAVPPIQLMKAYAEMSNGGYEVTPRVCIPDTGTTSTPAPARTQVISSSLSGALVNLQEHVVTTVPSYAQSTYIPGYYVGGKTGTAQIWDPTLYRGKGGWLENIYNYSFFGWVGHSSPDLIIGVVIYRGTPTKVGQGVLAMPVQSTALFRRVAADSVVSLKIAPNGNGPVAPSGQKAKSLG